MDRTSANPPVANLDWSLPATPPVAADWERTRDPSFQGNRGEVPLLPPASSTSQPRARFAPLSSLPPEKRLPARRGPDAPPPTPTGIAPRQLPGLPSVNPSKRSLEVKQIGFNCPSCLAILIIKQPENYDGQAAPCPSCGIVILPPRIAPISPFTLLSPHSPPPGLPGPRSTAPIPVGRPAPPATRKPGLPGAKTLAQAALL